MIWLGFRLGLSARPASIASAIVLVLTIALGLTASLASFGFASGVEKRADRGSWTVPISAELVGLTNEQLPGVSYVNWGQDYYRGEPVTVVSLAASDPSAPVPPGLEAVPAAGQVYVSPALHALIQASPALAERYGQVVGTVGTAGLASPTTLLAIRGVPLEVARLSGDTVAAFGVVANPVPLNDPARLLPALMLLAVLVLTAVLAVLATRIGGTQRRDRLGRLRLLGASSRQVRRVALFERLLPLCVGLFLGVGLFLSLHGVLAKVWIGDGTFFPSDITPTAGTWLVAIILVAGLGVASTQAELGRILADPTESVRGGEAPLRAGYRSGAAALLLGAVVALYSSEDAGILGGRTGTLLIAAIAALATVLLLGPWLLQRMGQLLRRQGGAVRLLAGRRHESSPRSAFRATAGVAVAIVISITYAAVAPSAYAELSDERVIGQQPGTAQVDVSDAEGTTVDELASQLQHLPGVESVASVSRAMMTTPDGPKVVWIGNCQALVTAARLADVPCGTAPVLVANNSSADGPQAASTFELYDFRPADVVGRNNEVLSEGSGSLIVRISDVAEMPANTAVDSPDVIIDRAAPGADLTSIRPSLLLVGHTADLDIEELRTLAYSTIPNVQVATRATSYDGFNQELRTVRDLVGVLSIGLYALAGLSVLVAANASLLERRDALLALLEAGATRRTVLRTLALESAVPVLVTGVAAALVGGLVGELVGSDRLPMAAILPQLLAGVGLATALSLVVLLPASRLGQTEAVAFGKPHD